MELEPKEEGFFVHQPEKAVRMLSFGNKERLEVRWLATEPGADYIHNRPFRDCA